eukprot:3827172-Pyramimonas_sp.AAC.1
MADRHYRTPHDGPWPLPAARHILPRIDIFSRDLGWKGNTSSSMTSLPSHHTRRGSMSSMGASVKSSPVSPTN